MRPPLVMLAVSALLLAAPLHAADATGPNAVPRKAPQAAGAKAPGRAADPESRHPTPHGYWYDGTERKALRIDPAWVADFGAPPVAFGRKPRSPLKRFIGGEKGLESLPAGASPVFRDENGTPRALPGGVIVRPHEADRSEARARLEAMGLVPVRPIDPEGRSWLVESAAGLQSLELANRLHESGQFESASPNWWRPRALK